MWTGPIVYHTVERQLHAKIFEHCPAQETGREELLKRFVSSQRLNQIGLAVKTVAWKIGWSKTEETTLMLSVLSRYFLWA